ncbi:GIY-YIG nuclease family protein [Deinococcus ficus]|uniref:GIY-YIG nuclease family protein n=1 Tax=Deinococcus ficus TaxID=317577 RepID=UPI001B7FCCF4|nr:hypothetical protein [Deinococcus ficus]
MTAVEIQLQQDVQRLTEIPPIRWSDLQAHKTALPKAPGVYAWWFSPPPAGVPLEGTLSGPAGHLLYVGIAGSNLHQRIRHQHFGGNAEGSTLRRTLGVVLADTLGIHLELSPSGTRLTFGSEGEKKLTHWMVNHASVGWLAYDHPHEFEDTALHTLCVPLNLKNNEHHPFHPQLTALRKKMATAAKLATPS